MTADETLDQLEDAMRKLSVEYEAYFGGSKKYPAADLIWRVDNYFRLLAENTQLKYAQRFRFNQLQQRHAVISRIWRRKTEILEGGWRRPADRLLSVSGAVDAKAAAAARPSACTVELGHDATRDQANIERLYAAFVQARQRASEPAPLGSLARFRELIEKKTQEVRRQGGGAVSASVSLEEGRVKLRLAASDASAKKGTA